MTEARGPGRLDRRQARRVIARSERSWGKGWAAVTIVATITGALAAADEPGGLSRLISWFQILPRTWTDAAYRGIARVRGVFGPPGVAAPADDPVWEKRYVR